MRLVVNWTLRRCYEQRSGIAAGEFRQMGWNIADTDRLGQTLDRSRVGAVDDTVELPLLYLIAVSLIVPL